MSEPFSKELVDHVQQLWKRYPEKKAALIPAMHLIQAERGGWFSEETVRDTAELFEVSDVHVRGIVGFYDMFHDEPVGRHVVRLCKTLACKLRGADELRAHIKESYGVDHGETTGDGRFTFRCFECLGHCSTAPMMLVDDEKYEELTPESLDKVLGGLE
ncbi:MAG: NADH-quinone oxidoreductase subunit NuoE [Planctomycetota bacterium]